MEPTTLTGMKIRIRGSLYHVRGFVDDNYVVMRTWSRRQGTWKYIVESIDVIMALLSDGTWKAEK